MKPTEYGNYVYPDWATAVGWTISLFSVSAIPIVAIIKICQANGPLLKRISILSKPTAEWGPKLQMHRMETNVPKHTDSQVPLTLPNYDPDPDAFDPDDNSDDAKTDEGEGLRLNIPSYIHETGF